ncbi:MAG: radical SAM protein [Hyphomonadaceae bacterium]
MADQPAGAQSQKQQDLVLANPVFDHIDGPARGFQLGLLYIATYVISRGWRAQIVAGEDVTSQIVRIIETGKNHPLVGFYVTADNVHEVERSSTALQNLFPDLNVVLGGPQARGDYRRLIERGYTRFVCVGGDGEECALRLLEELSRGDEGDFSTVPNLAYAGEAGAAKLSRTTVLPVDLDIFPIPDRSLFPDGYKNAHHIATSRGCASKCTFCYEGLPGKLRRHSVERVIDEMRYLHDQFGTQYFTFVDDTFTSDRPKVYEFCDRVKERFSIEEGVRWYCEAKVSDLCRAPEMARRMVDSGLARAQIGSESGNDEILEAYKKHITVAQIEEAVGLLADQRITSIFTNFIVGGVQETEASFRASLDLALRLMSRAPGILECDFTFLSPYINTDVQMRPDAYGIEVLDANFLRASSDSYLFARSKELSISRVLEMGRVFRAETDKKMSEIAKAISSETVRGQLVSLKIGMSTTWCEFLMRETTLRRWANMHGKGYVERVGARHEDYGKYVPVRTFDLKQVGPSGLRSATRGRQYRFSELEMFLLELSAGKISLSEVIHIAFERFGSGKVGVADFADDCVAFLEQCSSEFLLMFRKFG